MSEVEWDTAVEAISLARISEIGNFLELAVKGLKNLGWDVTTIQQEVWELYHGVGTNTTT